MRQVMNYLKLSYKNLLWVMLLTLFLLQFMVYYEEGKLVCENLNEKNGYIDLYFVLYLILFLPQVIKHFKTKEKIKTTKEENISFAILMIYLLLIFILEKFKISMNGIFNGIQIVFVVFLVLNFINNRNEKTGLRLLPINSINKKISVIIISFIIMFISLLSINSVVYADKLFNSGDLAKFYSGSIKGAFAILSFYCYRKFNMKKNKEEDVTETSVYKVLKGFGGKKDE